MLAGVVATTQDWAHAGRLGVDWAWGDVLVCVCVCKAGGVKGGCHPGAHLACNGTAAWTVLKPVQELCRAA
jgi:hypothetical protein